MNDELEEQSEGPLGDPPGSPIEEPATVPVEVAVDDPADSIADGVRHSLDPATVAVDRIAGLIGTAVLGALVILALPIGWLTGTFPTWLGFLLGGLALLTVFIGWISVIWPEKEYRHAAYRVTAVGIDIWKGVLWRKVTTVPRSRVQHTDVAQGPLQRKYGIATLHLHTAGTEQVNVEVRGLKHETALAIRDYLIAGHEDDAV